MPTEFEWDANKAKSNVGKHGVRFEDAILVFDDPRHLSRQDRIENGEYRWQNPWPRSWHRGQSWLLTAFGLKSGIEVIRIISARKADRKREESL